MKRILSLFLSALILLCGCGAKSQPKAASSGEFTFTDSLGRQVSLDKPQRVAALIGSFADVWVTAGGEDTLIAAAHDAWTSFDLALGEEVVDLGEVKQPDLERLLAAKPDFILASCNTASNLELKATFEQLSIPTAYFDIQHFDDYLNMLKICTELTGCPERFEKFGSDVEKQVKQAIARTESISPSVLCIRATGVSCKVKSSRDNLLGEMLFDLNCRNIADEDGALLESLSLEAIMRADPDYIFVVLQGADPEKAMKTLEKTLLANPAWQNLTAVKEGRFFTLEHRLYNLKPNARWGEAYEKLANILCKTE
ncbi:MAG: ABC transporter substrate-binding protein [Oscillospiraceae bacterium]|nr:ABC transporter substrate-binding protein [Oscillospiraceae bacterium]